MYFFKDSKQRIWLICFNGRIGYLQNNKFYNFENQAFLKDLNFNTFIADIFEDSKNNIWFSQSVNRIKKLDTANVITNFNELKSPANNKFKTAKLVENTSGEIKVLISNTKKQNNKEIQSSSLKDSIWKSINLSLYHKNTFINLRRKTQKNLKALIP